MKTMFALVLICLAVVSQELDASVAFTGCSQKIVLETGLNRPVSKAIFGLRPTLIMTPNGLQMKRMTPVTIISSVPTKLTRILMQRNAVCGDYFDCVNKYVNDTQSAAPLVDYCRLSNQYLACLTDNEDCDYVTASDIQYARTSKNTICEYADKYGSYLR